MLCPLYSIKQKLDISILSTPCLFFSYEFIFPVFFILNSHCKVVERREIWRSSNHTILFVAALEKFKEVDQAELSDKVSNTNFPWAACLEFSMLGYLALLCSIQCSDTSLYQNTSHTLRDLKHEPSSESPGRLVKPETAEPYSHILIQ